jgi:FKBP-type peptidyl-prolyl cis-trans isomerase SlyD
MKIAPGHIVRMSYELKVKGGEVIESSEKAGSMQYVHGEGKMLPGLEKRLEGMSVGEEKRGVIPAAEAFGAEESLPTKIMPRANFPKDEKIAVGKLFEAKGPQGQPVSFKVVTVKGDEVTVRFLHPLVGKDLEFWVKVLVIDDPKTKKREAVAPPPPPAAALAVELEDEGKNK